MTALAAEAAVITEPGIYEIPEDLYHADPVPGGSLSASGAKKLLPPSCPAVFRYEQQHPPALSETLELGTAAHKMVLGIGAEIVRVEADDWRKKVTQERGDEIRASGAIPLLRPAYAQVNAMAEAMRRHPLACALLDPARGGHPEQSLFAVDELTGVWLRSRLDWMPDPESSRPIIADYKTAASAEPGSFSRSAGNFGYYIQDAFYCEVYRLLTGITPEFVFIVQEKIPPYVVTVCQLDGPAVIAGAARMREAIERYRDCKEVGIWPAHSEEIEQISLPPWVRARGDYQ